MREVPVNNGAELFLSWAEFAQTAIAYPVQTPVATRVHDKWSGATPSVFKPLVQRGWEDGARDIEKRANSLWTEVTGGLGWKRKYFYADYPRKGFVGISVQRYYQGDPRFYRYGVDRLARGQVKVLDFVVNCGFPAHAQQNSIIRRGAAVAVAVRLLELAGYHVRVLGYLSGYAHPYRGEASREKDVFVEAYVEVKEAGQHIDLPVLAAALAHPSIWRRGGQAVIQRHKLAAQLPLGAGFIGEAHHQGDIYVPSLYGMHIWEDDSAAMDWTFDLLDAQGLKTMTSHKRKGGTP